ncbi:hypothetical protein BJ508DRAFT_312145 [Ascobolus immersus RN42]|uniref:Uncharacterized protein n=1 Tax=Ascobolus immersus RN42 TaxID=1160509 RepID=A0A3N4HN29_ASCIM|nr:hypothetical protein BJ508DRAFT_312145 [Ascobolus immersus RN42]
MLGYGSLARGRDRDVPVPLTRKPHPHDSTQCTRREGIRSPPNPPRPTNSVEVVDVIDRQEKTATPFHAPQASTTGSQHPSRQPKQTGTSHQSMRRERMYQQNMRREKNINMHHRTLETPLSIEAGSSGSSGTRTVARDEASHPSTHRKPPITIPHANPRIPQLLNRRTRRQEKKEQTQTRTSKKPRKATRRTNTAVALPTSSKLARKRLPKKSHAPSSQPPARRGGHTYILSLYCPYTTR